MGDDGDGGGGSGYWWFSGWRCLVVDGGGVNMVVVCWAEKWGERADTVQ